MSIPILIADDHGVLRAGLRAMLDAEPGLKVVGEAANGYEALQLAYKLCPKTVLLDMNMPRLSGIEVTRQIKQYLPEIRVIILTAYEDESLLREAVQAGADGYIIKRAIGSELVTAIQSVCRGDLYIHPAMTRALLKEPSPAPAPQKTPIESLTPQENEVLHLVAQRYSNHQIADTLKISINAVALHIANLLCALRLPNKTELVRYARQNNLA